VDHSLRFLELETPSWRSANASHNCDEGLQNGRSWQPRGCGHRLCWLKVLLVDDHRMFTELLAQQLREHRDIEVSGVARTATEALSAARNDPPDVAVLDYRLPDGNGAALAAQLHSDHPHLRLVMLTGYQDEATLREAIEAGCCGFITKDAAVDEVVASVRTAHAGGAPIAPALLGRLLPSLREDSKYVGGSLTARELQVMQLLAEGVSNRAIAARLFISSHTVRNHVQRIITKLGVHSKLEAVAVATRIGLVRAAEPSPGSAV
jgi:DNA-binding NarL/FixJ family response regulator